MKDVPADTGITLALGGIGMRGIANVGVLQALIERRVEIKRIVATGVGAIIAGYFALSRDPAEVVAPIASFFARNRRFLWGLEQAGGLNSAERRTAARSIAYFLRERLFCRENIDHIGIFPWSIVEDDLRRVFGETTAADLKIPLAVSAIDLTDGREALLDSGSIVELSMAGIAFPGLFPPVVMDGHRFLSSSLYCEIPLCSLTAVDRPIVAVTYSQDRRFRRPHSMLEIMACVDELRGAAVASKVLERADMLIELGRQCWSSGQRMERLIPLAKEATLNAIDGWDFLSISA
jgi:NTE family protein